MRSDHLRVGQFPSHFPERGGSTTVLLGLASGLLELGHDVVAYGWDNRLGRGAVWPRV